MRTPPRAGLGFAFKAALRGPSTVVPHHRIARSDVQAIEIVQAPPPGWRLVSDFLFLRTTTAAGDNWHWIDGDSMHGKMDRLEKALDAFKATRAPSR